MNNHNSSFQGSGVFSMLNVHNNTFSTLQNNEIPTKDIPLTKSNQNEFITLHDFSQLDVINSSELHPRQNLHSWTNSLSKSNSYFRKEHTVNAVDKKKSCSPSNAFEKLENNGHISDFKIKKEYTLKFPVSSNEKNSYNPFILKNVTDTPIDKKVIGCDAVECEIIKSDCKGLKNPQIIKIAPASHNVVKNQVKHTENRISCKANIFQNKQLENSSQNSKNCITLKNTLKSSQIISNKDRMDNCTLITTAANYKSIVLSNKTCTPAFIKFRNSKDSNLKTLKPQVQIIKLVAIKNSNGKSQVIKKLPNKIPSLVEIINNKCIIPNYQQSMKSNICDIDITAKEKTSSTEFLKEIHPKMINIENAVVQKNDSLEVTQIKTSPKTFGHEKLQSDDSLKMTCEKINLKPLYKNRKAKLLKDQNIVLDHDNANINLQKLDKVETIVTKENKEIVIENKQNVDLKNKEMLKESLDVGKQICQSKTNDCNFYRNECRTLLQEKEDEDSIILKEKISENKIKNFSQVSDPVEVYPKDLFILSPFQSSDICIDDYDFDTAVVDFPNTELLQSNNQISNVFSSNQNDSISCINDNSWSKTFINNSDDVSLSEDAMSVMNYNFTDESKISFPKIKEQISDDISTLSTCDSNISEEDILNFNTITNKFDIKTNEVSEMSECSKDSSSENYIDAVTAVDTEFLQKKETSYLNNQYDQSSGYDTMYVSKNSPNTFINDTSFDDIEKDRDIVIPKNSPIMFPNNLEILECNDDNHLEASRCVIKNNPYDIATENNYYETYIKTENSVIENNIDLNNSNVENNCVSTHLGISEILIDDGANSNKNLEIALNLDIPTSNVENNLNFPEILENDDLNNDSKVLESAVKIDIKYLEKTEEIEQNESHLKNLSVVNELKNENVSKHSQIAEFTDKSESMSLKDKKDNYFENKCSKILPIKNDVDIHKEAPESDENLRITKSSIEHNLNSPEIDIENATYVAKSIVENRNSDHSKENESSKMCSGTIKCSNLDNNDFDEKDIKCDISDCQNQTSEIKSSFWSTRLRNRQKYLSEEIKQEKENVIERKRTRFSSLENCPTSLKLNESKCSTMIDKHLDTKTKLHEIKKCSLSLRKSQRLLKFQQRKTLNCSKHRVTKVQESYTNSNVITKDIHKEKYNTIKGNVNKQKEKQTTSIGTSDSEIPNENNIKELDISSLNHTHNDNSINKSTDESKTWNSVLNIVATNSQSNSSTLGSSNLLMSNNNKLNVIVLPMDRNLNNFRKNLSIATSTNFPPPLPKKSYFCTTFLKQSKETLNYKLKSSKNSCNSIHHNLNKVSEEKNNELHNNTSKDDNELKRDDTEKICEDAVNEQIPPKNSNNITTISTSIHQRQCKILPKISKNDDFEKDTEHSDYDDDDFNDPDYAPRKNSRKGKNTLYVGSSKFKSRSCQKKQPKPRKSNSDESPFCSKNFNTGNLKNKEYLNPWLNFIDNAAVDAILDDQIAEFNMMLRNESNVEPKSFIPLKCYHEIAREIMQIDQKTIKMIYIFLFNKDEEIDMIARNCILEFRGFRKQKILDLDKRLNFLMKIDVALLQRTCSLLHIDINEKDKISLISDLLFFFKGPFEKFLNRPEIWDSSACQKTATEKTSDQEKLDVESETIEELNNVEKKKLERKEDQKETINELLDAKQTEHNSSVITSHSNETANDNPNLPSTSDLNSNKTTTSENAKFSKSFIMKLRINKRKKSSKIVKTIKKKISSKSALKLKFHRNKITKVKFDVKKLNRHRAPPVKCPQSENITSSSASILNIPSINHSSTNLKKISQTNLDNDSKPMILRSKKLTENYELSHAQSSKENNILSKSLLRNTEKFSYDSNTKDISEVLQQEPLNLCTNTIFDTESVFTLNTEISSSVQSLKKNLNPPKSSNTSYGNPYDTLEVLQSEVSDSSNYIHQKPLNLSTKNADFISELSNSPSLYSLNETSSYSDLDKELLPNHMYHKVPKYLDLPNANSEFESTEINSEKFFNKETLKDTTIYSDKYMLNDEQSSNDIKLKSISSSENSSDAAEALLMLGTKAFDEPELSLYANSQNLPNAELTLYDKNMTTNTTQATSSCEETKPINIKIPNVTENVEKPVVKQNIEVIKSMCIICTMTTIDSTQIKEYLGQMACQMCIEFFQNLKKTPRKLTCTNDGNCFPKIKSTRNSVHAKWNCDSCWFKICLRYFTVPAIDFQEMLSSISSCNSPTESDNQVDVMSESETTEGEVMSTALTEMDVVQCSNDELVKNSDNKSLKIQSEVIPTALSEMDVDPCSNDELVKNPDNKSLKIQSEVIPTVLTKMDGDQGSNEELVEKHDNKNSKIQSEMIPTVLTEMDVDECCNDELVKNPDNESLKIQSEVIQTVLTEMDVNQCSNEELVKNPDNKGPKTQSELITKELCKSPRIKHVCRTATTALRLPMACFRRKSTKRARKFNTRKKASKKTKLASIPENDVLVSDSKIFEEDSESHHHENAEAYTTNEEAQSIIWYRRKSYEFKKMLKKKEVELNMYPEISSFE